MKKIIYCVAAFAAIFSVSCTKEKQGPDAAEPAILGTALISARADFLPAVETRALSPYTAMEPRDLKIDRYHMAFFKDGHVVKEVVVNNAGITDGRIPATEVTLPVGSYSVYLAANAYTSLGEIYVMNDNDGTPRQYNDGDSPDKYFWNLTDDAPGTGGTLVHTGSGTLTVSAGDNPTQASTASLSLKRRVARIRVNSIKNNLPSGIDVELESVYLMNCVSRDLLFSDYDYPGLKKWAYLGNAAGKTWEEDEDGNLVARILGECNFNDEENYVTVKSPIAFKNIQQTVNKGGSYTQPFNLYCYRSQGTATSLNLSEYSTEYPYFDGLWSGNSGLPATNLVVAVGIGNNFDTEDSGRYMVYYPINLAEVFSQGIKANYSYVLDITLNDLGSTDPATPIVHGAASVAAQVADWDNGGTGSVEI